MNHRIPIYRHSVRILVVLFCVLSGLFVFSLPASAQDKPSSLEDMIDREQPEARDSQAELEKYIAKQPEKVLEIEKKTAELSRELRRTLLIHSVAEINPIDCRNTIKKMNALRKSALGLVEPLYGQIKNISDFEKFVDERKEEYRRLGEDRPGTDAGRRGTAYVEELTKLLALTRTAKQLVTFIPHQVEDFLLGLDRKKSAVERELGDSWRTYFLRPLPKTYFASETWKVAYLTATKWPKYVPLFGLTPDRDQRNGFRAFILKVVLSGLIASLISYFLLKRLGARSGNRRTVRYGLPFAIWSAFGLSIIVNTIISENFDFGAYQPFGEICLAAGLLSLAWNVRTSSLEGIHAVGRNIFLPLWLLFAAGIAVQVLRVPIVTMSPVLAALLIACAVYYYLVRKRVSYEPEKKLSVLTAGLTGILALAALLGYGALSILVSALWFMVALNVELGSALNGWFRKVMRAETERPAGLILFGNMILPLVFIGLFALVVMWAAIYVSGMPLLQKIVQWKINWSIVSLRITTVLTLAALFFIARSFIAFFHTAITFIKRRSEGIEEGVIRSLQTVASYVVWFCYILVSLNFLGVGIGNLTIIAGGLSVGVGFAFQDLIKNFVSGLILLFGRSIHPGDEIQLEDVHGRVEKINMRSTVVQTNDDSTVFLPNFDLVSKKIVNWTHKDPKGRAEITVGVAYGSDTILIKDLLIQCALSNPDVLRAPPPYVLFHDFGDNALVFSLRFWIMHVILSKDRIRSAIRFEIERVFKERNIEISYPQHDFRVNPTGKTTDSERS